MALNDISLTAGMRSNLISLQGTTKLLDRTQERLSSGKKVNSALDNPTNFFAAQSHTQRAADLSVRKDAMTEAVQGVQAANKGITGITALIEAAKGLTQAARSADSTNRNSLGAQFNTVLTQITQLASDSGYKGKNFLTGDSLNVLFNENGSSLLTITGFSATAAGLSITSITIGTTGTQVGSTSFTMSPAIALHTGVGVAAVNTTGVSVTSYYNIGGATGTASASGGTTGVTFTLDFSGMFTGSSGLISGLGSISGMSINGVDISGWTGNVTNFGTGKLIFTITGNAASGYVTGTTLEVSVNFAVAPHNSDGTTGVTPLTTTFELKTGDLFGGLNNLSGVSYTGAVFSGLTGQTIVGPYVAISGQYVSPDQYTITQSGGKGYITFTTGVPVPTAVTYGYNTGYSDLNGIAVTSNVFTGQTLTTGQSITAVYSSGVQLDSSLYTVTGEKITLTTGAVQANLGKALTYTVSTVATGGWALDSGIDDSVNQLNTAIETLRTKTANLASNLSVVTIRQDFTDGMVNTLLKGADNLTLADMNEEGANMLMLQTRQQLGTQSLSMASQAAQSVLRLF